MTLQRFAVVKTRAGADAAAPFLVVLSSDFLSDVNVVIVAPVRRLKKHGPLRRRLHVPVRLNDEDMVVVIEELLSLPRAALGPRVADLAPDRDALVAALDFLFQGH